ncbi:hypothetical protein, partial [Pseudoalteromonas sp.]|uniref:hypothetical protein n=1 Tax=Pseudoalteromonas sp. TaxID=53249 RepID=UPI00260D81F0
VLTRPDKTGFDKSPYFKMSMVPITFNAINVTTLNVVFERSGEFTELASFRLTKFNEKMETCGTIALSR